MHDDCTIYEVPPPPPPPPPPSSLPTFLVYAAASYFRLVLKTSYIVNASLFTGLTGGGGLWLRAGRRAIVSAAALYSVCFVNVSLPLKNVLCSMSRP